MQPESKKLLADMLDAANSIVEFSAGKSREVFLQDKILRAAIHFQFVVIGEALAQLRQRDEQTAAQLSESPRIVGFRNQIIHGYSKIDAEITWEIISNKLPVLLAELKQLLAQ